MSLREKQLALALKDATSGAPTDAMLAKINTFTARQFTADELYARTAVLAHNGIDRDGEVFDEPVLDAFTRTLPGKGLFEKHPTGWDGDSGMPEGAWFDARVERMSFDAARQLLREPNLQFPPDRKEAALLYASFYVPKMAANEELRTKVDAGLGFVSIGFQVERTDPIKDAQGREIRAVRLTGEAQAYEGSLVWLGAQPGARVVKNAKDKTMELKLALIAALGLAAAASEQDILDTVSKHQKAAGAAPDPTIAKFGAVKTALGDHAALLDTPAELAAAVIDGKTYRTSLADDLIAAERAQGLIKADSPEQLATVKAAYSSMPLAHLKTLHDAAVKRGAAPRLPPGNPGAGNATPADARPSALDSPLI